MTKLLVGIVAITCTCITLYSFAEADAKSVLDEKKTANMFIDSDTDEFDPGLGVGEIFPQIDAYHQEQRITSITEFAGVKGTVFFANRSVDW